jgi:hypothetical protein
MLNLPRRVIHKKLKSGMEAFYCNIPTAYRTLGCRVRNEPLGTDYSIACKRAAALNGLFDEWDASRKGLAVTSASSPADGRLAILGIQKKQSLP